MRDTEASQGEPQLQGATWPYGSYRQRGAGCLWAGIIPEELEAHSLPVSRSLSPSLVSATAEAGVFEQEAPTTWCLRRRRPEHLDLGLCSAANSLAPSCNQSRRQGRWQMTREHKKAFPQALAQALPCYHQGKVEDPPCVVTAATAKALPPAPPHVPALFPSASLPARKRLPGPGPPVRSPASCPGNEVILASPSAPALQLPGTSCISAS